MSTERQWAVGQLVDTGHRINGKANRMLILGPDNNIYTGCLVYVDEEGKVGTMATKFFKTYSSITIINTDLEYKYTTQDQASSDLKAGVFKKHFKNVTSAQS